MARQKGEVHGRRGEGINRSKFHVCIAFVLSWGFKARGSAKAFTGKASYLKREINPPPQIGGNFFQTREFVSGFLFCFVFPPDSFAAAKGIAAICKTAAGWGLGL